MKQMQHVEAGDKLYILLKDEVKTVTLTDDHINNRSKSSPSFLVDKLRLASTEIENDQVKLEKGYFYDNSVGMSVDYGYRFSDSNVKAFISMEALEYYRDVYHANRVKLVTEDFNKMKSIVDEHLAHIAAALESHRGFNRLHQITEEERESLDYRFIEELHEAIYGEPMF